MDDYSRNVMVFIFIILLIMVILFVLGAPIFMVFMFGFSVAVIVVVCKFFNIDVIALIFGLFNKSEQTPSPTIITPSPPSINEVFNVPDKKYNYTDAKLICKAFNSRLANYNEIKKANDSGAEWCNYGWSNKQMVLMPTQEKTYHELRNIPGHENDCGRPGINGGYVKNANEKYSANCYGVKPKMTSEDEQLMNATELYPLTEEDMILEQKVNDWKNSLSQILVSPFNHLKWAMSSSNYTSPTPKPTTSASTTTSARSS